MFKLSRFTNSLIFYIVSYFVIFALIQLVVELIGMAELTAISVLKSGAIGGVLGAVKYYWSKNENNTPEKKKAKPVE